MSEPIISVRNISKDYTISHQASYGTLRDALTNITSKIFRGSKTSNQESFHALTDVNFDVQQGERIGIIGRNGAGKSTLLKILSQITPPTSGTVKLRGRVASLLEVGTGFHPELTGRENIFLNGAILGMKQSEIRKKIDEIVAFAEIEKFLDTPVKRYSSGMYVRLAFAVAAQLDPEILIVDEVLAVGDAQFQKKCLGKMKEVSEEGRTILFVSHNMAAIHELCSRAILLDKGRVVQEGPTAQVINAYMSESVKLSQGSEDLSDPKLRKNSIESSRVKWQKISIENAHHVVTNHINYQEPFTIKMVASVTEILEDLHLSCTIRSSLGFEVLNTFQIDEGARAQFDKGIIECDVCIDPNLLSPGSYEIGIGANGPRVIDWIPTAIQLDILETNTETNKSWKNHRVGMIYYPYNWKITQANHSL